MSEFFGFKIDTGQHPSSNANPYGWHPTESKEEKWQRLIHALELGDVEHSRQCFVALLNVAPHLQNHPVMAQLSSALQSSNLPWAQKLGRDLKKLGAVILRSAPQHEKPSEEHLPGPQPQSIYALEHVDLRA